MFFNECIDQGNVPFLPKHVSIMPVCNKAYRTSVDNLKNYRETILTHFMEKLISKCQCGFRKGSTILSPRNVTEIEKICRSKNGFLVCFKETPRKH